MCPTAAPVPTFDHRRFLRDVTEQPGVYRMLDHEGTVLYVGKARNLKKRLASYFRPQIDSPRIRAMVARIAEISISVTHTELEALLLESNLIKQHRPRYNVLLRDDKSYPFIYLSAHAYPRLSLYRGTRRRSGQSFGPYPSATAVRESLSLLQKLFLLRDCEDSQFAHRTRPCLQHQIKRCSAPCVSLISAEDYRHDVASAVQFLQGQSQQVITRLIAHMETASAQLEFERAARYRDQIAQLRQISAQQYINAKDQDVDIIAAHLASGAACVQVFSIRNGYNLGNRALFPLIQDDTHIAALLAAFMAQYYLSHPPPAQILLNAAPDDPTLLSQMLSLQRGAKVQLAWKVRGARARWLALAQHNAQLSLQTRLLSQNSLAARFAALEQALGLAQPVQRIECFDISHTQGEYTVASCVVFDPQGPVKADYRRFNIEGITPGDDYAAMQQALSRRYRRLSAGEGRLPDVLLIDGGRGQVREALAVLNALAVSGVYVVGVAKGEGRRPGLERLVLSDAQHPTILPQDSQALHLIQQVRDEAHRFALTGHRQRKRRAQTHSPLEHIPGIGPKRRAVLLRHFGGLSGIRRAGVEELSQVPGISQHLAQQIHDHFHPD
ncbi:excinuclease ABC subunit UvrC [Thiorhodospira sibirica]|uniref:excinuclease ABC subunit UvrC n=1 Tax=Thiorhodospira sibirica TaxID=154347 RepID=UPI00022C17D6|nr:excinuclease ABC subunit UvrC [Thiorhodospira sibirica]